MDDRGYELGSVCCLSYSKSFPYQNGFKDDHTSLPFVCLCGKSKFEHHSSYFYFLPNLGLIALNSSKPHWDDPSNNDNSFTTNLIMAGLGIKSHLLSILPIER